MQRVVTYVDDRVAVALEGRAVRDRRSVSATTALLLEEALGRDLGSLNGAGVHDGVPPPAAAAVGGSSSSFKPDPKPGKH